MSTVYRLPPLDRRPIETKVKKDIPISGKILGVKGALLLLSVGNLPHFLNLKHLIGRKIELNGVDAFAVQTALDRF